MKSNVLTAERLAVSAKTLARMLDVSERQIRDWLSSGGIGPSPTKLGDRLTRFDAREISEWWHVCQREGRRIGRVEWLRMKNERSQP